jgi:hypothetical protein
VVNGYLLLKIGLQILCFIYVYGFYLHRDFLLHDTCDFDNHNYD